MKRIKLKIFPKIFICSLSLIIGVVIISFLLIALLIPKFYRAYKEDILQNEMNNLTPSLENKNITEMVDVLSEFAQKNEYNITLTDVAGR
jgi:hypothetical protein